MLLTGMIKILPFWPESKLNAKFEKTVKKMKLFTVDLTIKIHSLLATRMKTHIMISCLGNLNT